MRLQVRSLKHVKLPIHLNYLLFHNKLMYSGFAEQKNELYYDKLVYKLITILSDQDLDPEKRKIVKKL